MWEKNDMIHTIKSMFVKYKYIVLVIAVGALLLLWPSGGTKKPETKDNFEVSTAEKRLEEVLTKASGVGRVKVLLSVKDGEEVTYAIDTNTTSDKKYSERILSDTDSSEQSSVVKARDSAGNEVPVVIKVKYPQYMGALIVCDGGDNAKVKLAVTRAVCGILGISSDSITIIKMEN